MAAFPSREVLNTFDQRWFFEQSLLQPEILKQGPSRREKSASNPSTTSRILQGPTANDVAESHDALVTLQSINIIWQLLDGNFAG